LFICCIVFVPVVHLQRELSGLQESRDTQLAEHQRQTEENAQSKHSLLDKKVKQNPRCQFVL
jgi:hypothetical protein